MSDILSSVTGLQSFFNHSDSQATNGVQKFSDGELSNTSSPGEFRNEQSPDLSYSESSQLPYFLPMETDPNKSANTSTSRNQAHPSLLDYQHLPSFEDTYKQRGFCQDQTDFTPRERTNTMETLDSTSGAGATADFMYMAPKQASPMETPICTSGGPDYSQSTISTSVTSATERAGSFIFPVHCYYENPAGHPQYESPPPLLPSSPSSSPSSSSSCPLTPSSSNPWSYLPPSVHAGQSGSNYGQPGRGTPFLVTLPRRRAQLNRSVSMDSG